VTLIGLTGGIGSGKTTVAARFAALGAAVVDTDDISRSLTAAGGAALESLRRAFDAKYFSADGALDRGAMRSLAFEDPGARERLESILHPAIRAAADSALAGVRGPYALVVVPLLFETRGYLDRIARALAVDCAPEVQVRRTMARSALPRAAVESIMAAQWPRWRRLQMADDVVWNGGEIASIDAQCERLHGFYCTIAANPRRAP
jgi:dephospho-CoA kinase